MTTSTPPKGISEEFFHRMDPDYVQYHAQNLAWRPMNHTVPFDEIRAFPKKYAPPWAQDLTYLGDTRDVTIKSTDNHDLKLRIYQPDTRTSAHGTGPYPIHVNFHGGGFALGDLTTDAGICTMIKNRVGILVVDVDYRLAPENHYLSWMEDAWAAIQWVKENAESINGNPDSISVGGISGGACMAAVMQQKAKIEGLHLRLAILGTPIVTSHLHFTTPESAPYKSFQENQNAPYLSWEKIIFFRDQYMLKPEKKKTSDPVPNYYVSPIDGDFKGLCTTYVATTDCDVLRDEGEHYADKLREAGVKVISRRFIGVPHTFMNMLPLKQAQLYMDDICDALRTAHGQRSL